MKVNKKIVGLINRIKKYEKAAIAFSGGKDSYFLLKMAIEALGSTNVLALFVIHPFISKNDFKRVDYFKGKLDFNLKTVTVDFNIDSKIWSNPRDRCYHCKRLIFQTIRNETRKMGIGFVFDGTSYSDLSEYRPGLVALEELQIIAPLKDTGITSGYVEQYLADSGIEPFYLSSSTCLATRFPYGHALSEDELKTFDDIESFFIGFGIFPIRIRAIPDGIRIETLDHHFNKIMELKNKIIDYCQKKGIKWVSLDIEGLKSGSWD